MKKLLLAGTFMFLAVPAVAIAAFKGDPGVSTVSVKRVDKNTIEETDIRDGKPISVAHMTAAADGKSIAFEVKDLRQDTTVKYVAVKQ